MKKIYLTICVVLLLTNCKRTSPNQVSDSQKETHESPLYIPLENILQQEGVVTLSSDASGINYIPLETTNSSLIKRIDKVIFWNNYILVSELYNIYLFDQSGKFVKQIGQRGNGPKDYIQIANTISDPSAGTLYVFDIKKMIKFDKEAKYIDSYPLNEYYSQGLFTSDRNFLIHNTDEIRVYGDTTKLFCLIEMDTVGHIVRNYENKSPRYVKTTKFVLSTVRVPLYEYNNQIRFHEFGSDTIFTIHRDTNTMEPYAILDLGKMKFDVNPDMTPYNSFFETNALLDKFKDKLTLNDIFENENHLYLGLMWGFGGDDFYCAYNKKTKETTFLGDKGLSNDIDGGISFSPKQMEENGKKMVTWMSAEKFREEILSKDYATQKAKYGERFEKVHQLATSLRDDDNPVLIITGQTIPIEGNE